MGWGVDEVTLAPEASRKWGISRESAEEVLDKILWPEDHLEQDVAAIYDDAESEMSLRELNNKHNLGISKEIILESESN